MNILLDSFADIWEFFEAIWQAISVFWFIVLPVAFYYLFKLLWMDFAQEKFAKSIKWTMLEIIPPRDIEKSPKPMESIYAGLTGIMRGFNAFEEFVEGMFILKFSLEIVSNEGSVHFYIRTPKDFKNLVEAHIYAQYPEAEIMEVPDYVDEVPKVIPNKNWDLWGCDFELTKPDPYPIKSYTWFEESITGTMIDPLASLIETIGKLGPEQKIWLQFVITPEKDTWYNTGRKLIEELTGRGGKTAGFFEKLLGDLGDIFQGIFGGMFGPVEFAKKEENGDKEAPLEFRLTPGEKDVLKALESGIGKSVFKTKMRFIYLGKRENFDKSSVSSFMGGIRQFADMNLNSFKIYDRSKTYALHLFADARMLYRQRKIFRRYKDRDLGGATFILNTEELATVFHMPDMSVMAPALHKVEAKKGGAPANLPVG